MEGLITAEELVGYDSTRMIAKGKRTKRLRLLTPSGGVAPSISSCSSGGGDDHDNSFSISSSTTNQEEEEDMANCLILLAQGGGGSGGGGDSHHHHHQDHDDDDDDHGDGNKRVENFKGRKISEMGVATNNNSNKVGFYIYECKTCNRTFPSFQALGGHRASHKRPKLTMMVTAEEKKPLSPPASPTPLPPPPPPSVSQSQLDTNYDQHQFELGGGERQQQQIKIGSSSISLQLGATHKNSNGNNNKGNKIHECSICGSEFTSGQALGGHMRRHRASTNTTTPMMTGIEVAAAVAVEVQPKNILELDLNLPAPEEDLRPEPPKFQFTAATQKSMVLSAAPALVDCHY